MRTLLAAIVVATFVSTASAQTGSTGRFEIGAGARWTGGLALGESAATETRPGGERFTLFGTDSRVDRAVGVDARAGVRLTRAFQIEAAFGYRRPTLTTQITSDAEGIPDVEAVERTSEFLIEGALLFHPPWRPAGRLEPFVAAGGGAVRYLHERRTVVENGEAYFLGGGATLAFSERDRSRLKGLGVRVDVRAVVTSGGMAFDDRAHVGAAAGASMFVRF
jgi:hypothetical protein